MKNYIKNQENEFVSGLNQALADANKVKIIAHKGPDDDAISSSLAMYWYVKANFEKLNVSVEFAGERVERWKYFEGFEEVGFYTNGQSFEGVDMVIMVDVSQWERATMMEKIPESLINKVWVIDHHKNAPQEGTITFIDANASSCAELIYRLFYKDIAPEKRLAEVLLLGIIGDTGSFTYVKPTQTEVFSVAERLVREGGVDIQAMKATYMQYSEVVYRVLAYLMNKMRLMDGGDWGTYSVAILEREVAQGFTSLDKDIKAGCEIYVNNYAKSITGCNWGFVIYPSLSLDQYNVSARSLPSGVNVRELFQGMGVGGGHDLASGGKFLGANSGEEVMLMIQTYLKDHSPIQFN